MSETLTLVVETEGEVMVRLPSLRPGDTVRVQVDVVANEAPRPRLQFGAYRGKIWIADDFNAPIEDFAEYM
ncbi:MAG: hypothetical protein SFX74_02010 [Fimbriimonadaceae bacterium]|nr:hypothetical protein [Fimbriimonadaceae bacterium]